MPGSMVPCCKCGKPTRSHIFFGVRLVFCHEHWESLSEEERVNIENKNAEYNAKLIKRGIEIMMKARKKKRSVQISDNVTLVEGGGDGI